MKSFDKYTSCALSSCPKNWDVVSFISNAGEHFEH